jgi:hypothetical protein
MECVRKVAVHKSTVRTIGCPDRINHTKLQTALTAFIRNISQADLRKVFANKIKRIQACIDARGHHFPTPFISAQRLSERIV